MAIRYSRFSATHSEAVGVAGLTVPVTVPVAAAKLRAWLGLGWVGSDEGARSVILSS